MAVQIPYCKKVNNFGGLLVSISDLLDRFNAILSENKWWARFVNTQFVQMMTVFAAQVIYTAETFASRALTEGFLSSATNRTSILAMAEDRGYVGRFVEPSSGTISIKNKTEKDISLPPGAEVLASDQTAITIVSAIKIPAGETVTQIPVMQRELVSISYDIDSEVEFKTVYLPREITAEVSGLDVYVITGEGSNQQKNKWTYNPLFRMSRSDSKHYVMVYKSTEQLGIRFGDGSMGKMPPAGCSVRIDVWASSGDYTLAEGQKLEAAGNIATYKDSLELITDSVISGGSGTESTEITRNRAMYYVAYDEQVVWGGDYRHFIEGRIGNIAWLNVWGEAKQEELTGFDVRNINRIFFSGHKVGITQAQLEEHILAELETVPNELCKHFEYVAINEMPFTINFVGVLKKDEIIEDAEAEIKAVLEEKFGRDSSYFKGKLENENDKQQGRAAVEIKEIWSAIESLSLFVSYDIEAIGKQEAVAYNDFVYMDVEGSSISIDYKKAE
jgi:hypothetical protein